MPTLKPSKLGCCSIQCGSIKLANLYKKSGAGFSLMSTINALIVVQKTYFSHRLFRNIGSKNKSSVPTTKCSLLKLSVVVNLHYKNRSPCGRCALVLVKIRKHWSLLWAASCTVIHCRNITDFFVPISCALKRLWFLSCYSPVNIMSLLVCCAPNFSKLCIAVANYQIYLKK